jgi:hypothetical protein
MTTYIEHKVICIVQSDEANKAWAEFSQLVMDNPELQINRDGFNEVLNKILATRTHDDGAMDEAVKLIHKSAIRPMTEETVDWLIQLMDDIAVALKRAIPVLTPGNPGVVSKCELMSHTKRNFVLNVTIIESINPEGDWTVIHF